ncbi:Co2+/Mg2+ efflux protein ApaG [Acetobacteraceae bacterium ESL0709]|nr:Co2+/Mg2+ efflux protein ApaG [Acetobacteraceae bacterium ESL0697]MDF7677581.1 Co2+/Mg2+ efflux protein ApaG [Acetobacteraceae bacterium ESL0709]
MSDQIMEFAEGDELEMADPSSLIRSPSYTARTGDITVTVRPIWIEELSDVKDQIFTWVYHIIIENGGEEAMQLTGRTWSIFDGAGNEVSAYSDGIGGELPVIAPHAHFEYTSGAELRTPSGFMSGAYHARLVEEDHYFDVTIPMFSLDSPHQNRLIQ